MKNNLFIKINIVLFIMILLGTIMIYLSYKLIPIASVQDNVYKSARIIEKLGINKPVLPGKKVISNLDTFTDSLMLLNVITKKDASTLERSLLVYRYNDNSGVMNITLSNLANNKKMIDTISYPRYWHGYLIFLRPLLLLLDYGGILTLNMVVQILTVLSIVFLMIKKKQYRLIAPYILLICSLIPIVIMKSIQYSSVWYIFNIGIILLLLKKEKIEENFYVGCIIFTILGALTSYFDLLTYPLITLGVPLVVYFSITNNKKANKIWQLAKASISWAYGYAIMWGSKWIIATLLTNENVIKNAFHAANERSSSLNITLEHFSRLEALKGNFDYFFNGYVIISLLVFLLIFIIKIDKNKIKNIRKQVPLIIISFYPIIWYLALANHSYIHSWMTNKSFAITYFAILMLITNITKKTSD